MKTLKQRQADLRELEQLTRELKRLNREWEQMADRIEAEKREPTPAELRRAEEIRDRELAIKRTGLRLGVKWR